MYTGQTVTAADVTHWSLITGLVVLIAAVVIHLIRRRPLTRNLLIISIIIGFIPVVAWLWALIFLIVQSVSALSTLASTDTCIVGCKDGWVQGAEGRYRCRNRVLHG